MSASADLVRQFWRAMSANDWTAAASLMAPDAFTLWPQTGEVIPSARFAEVQAAFLGDGDWQFEEMALVDGGNEVVTDMRVTNLPLGILARVITFHTIANGQLVSQREFWPDATEIPAFRQGMLVIDPDHARL
ncbi:nuclear transport factor 2 family protein [Paracoccus suum]|uniref:Nuclear transport factor 2 family protein n=1 Tax=Paracoccus suum TaxID=2259340 RepID=A0A344PHU2_9RHOB|nr:nuclear transport factor 2 family protein [Paracoccus suum]AXC48947.1 nuclear transport factor 2 family protein [Paracoccus suum]